MDISSSRVEKPRSYHIYFFVGEEIVNVVANGLQNYGGFICSADMGDHIAVSVREVTTVEVHHGYVWLDNNEVL